MTSQVLELLITTTVLFAGSVVWCLGLPVDQVSYTVVEGRRLCWRAARFARPKLSA